MLTSLQNPLVKHLRKLHRARDRHAHQQFLLEGTHLLEEAFAVQWPLLSVCCTPVWQESHPDLWKALLSFVPRAELVSEEVLKAIATTVEPDGVVAVAERRVVSPSPDAVVRLGVALETLQDPGNMGTIIRTAAAAGISELWVSHDSVDLDHPKVLRSSAGQWFRLPMRVFDDLETAVKNAQSQGIQIIATLPNADQLYWDADFSQPSLIVMGNEGAGLSQNLADLADVQVKIPLAPGVESLNVAIATALILYEAQRQRWAHS